jgi:hypothetical protein
MLNNKSLFSIVIVFYLSCVYIFSKFYFFDPEYFLFFSSTVLFYVISTFINSFLNDLIISKYDIQLVRFEKISANLFELNTFSTKIDEIFSQAVLENIFLFESKFDQLDLEFSMLNSNDEFVENSLESHFKNLLVEAVQISVNFSTITFKLSYNEFYQNLFIKLVQNPKVWRRRQKLSKSIGFSKYFKTSKKFYAVAWPLKPGEYKIPRGIIDL